MAPNRIIQHLRCRVKRCNIGPMARRVTSSDVDDGWGFVLLARAVVQGVEEASQDPAVLAFRRDLPEGKLLSKSRAPRWATDVAIEEGETTLRRQVFAAERSADHSTGTDIVEVKERLMLPLPVGGPVPARADGTLGTLLAISHDLRRRFGWPVDAAAFWVLTGRFEGIRTAPRIEINSGPPGAEVTDWAFVEIETPVEMPASYLAEAYAETRRRVAERQPTLTLRGARIGEKQLAVMMFAVERNDGRSWESMLEEWTRREASRHPDWTYSSFRNFARDARETYERVVGRPWIHGRLKEAEGDAEA